MIIKIPAIHGYIDRRILINYTLDPLVAKSIIPAPFRPLLHKGSAIVGICLIRLKNIKPKGFPDMVGIGSENAAHRFAVEWDEDGVTKHGVYIPRRDTSRFINTVAGGRLFPGKHYRAKFNVQEQNGHYNVGFISSDGTTLSVSALKAGAFPDTSVFGNIHTASAFFKNGCLGYTPASKGFDGVTLNTYTWQVQPLEVQNVQSSYFEDRAIFPEGCVAFDNALLMEHIEHEWHVKPVRL